MTTSYQESRLEFRFGQHWQVNKYDDHRFYRALSGAGLKGVDFIGIWKTQKLVLIEVKNYKLIFPTKAPPIEKQILGSLPLLLETMTYKIEDTFLAVNTIIKYYQRRWWYPPCKQLFSYFPTTYLLRFEWGYWTYVQRMLLQQPEQVDLVLWLELEESYEGVTAYELQTARQFIQDELQKKFPAYCVVVCDMGDNCYQKQNLCVKVR